MFSVCTHSCNFIAVTSLWPNTILYNPGRSYTSRCSSLNICCPQITQWQAAPKWGCQRVTWETDLGGFRLSAWSHMHTHIYTYTHRVNVQLWPQQKYPILLALIMQHPDIVVPCCEGDFMGKHQTSHEGWCVASNYLLMGLPCQRPYSSLLNLLLSQTKLSCWQLCSRAEDTALQKQHGSMSVAMPELYHSLPAWEEET